MVQFLNYHTEIELSVVRLLHLTLMFLTEIDLFLKVVVWKYFIKCIQINNYSILGALTMHFSENRGNSVCFNELRKKRKRKKILLFHFDEFHVKWYNVTLVLDFFSLFVVFAFFSTCKNGGLVPGYFSSAEVNFNKITSSVLKRGGKGKKKKEVLKTFLKQHHLKDSVQFNEVHKHMLLFSKRTLGLLGSIQILLLA